MPLRQIERLRLAPERNRNVLRYASKLSLWRLPLLRRDIFQFYLHHITQSAIRSSHLARRKPPSGCDRKNGYPGPYQFHKSRRIRAIKDCVCCQQRAAADIEELVRSRVSFQFLMRNHRVSDKERSCSYPSDRIKPYVIVHTLESLRDEYITASTSSAAFVSFLQPAQRGRRVFRRGRGPDRSEISKDQLFSFSGIFQLHPK